VEVLAEAEGAAEALDDRDDVAAARSRSTSQKMS
jgi:hypothetical protein